VASRFVVALRANKPDLDQALRIKERADALGGTLCAWGAYELCFSFEPSDIDEAVGLAAAASTVSSGAFAAAIAFGRLETIVGSTALAELGWGAPMSDATAIVESAQPGTIHVHPSANGMFDGTPHAAQLGDVVTLRSPTGAAPQARPLLPGTSTPQPPSTRRSTGFSELPPAPEVRAAADLVVDAIRRGDLAAFEKHVEELRAGGASPNLIARLTGLAALGRGATLDALRTLRTAADSAEPTTRTRAALAYAVALGAAGRNDEALLAALGALGAARTNDDRFGERACARFLAQLSAAGGFTEASLSWDRVALRAAGSTDDAPSS
jgi:hypothetical protein